MRSRICAAHSFAMSSARDPAHCQLSAVRTVAMPFSALCSPVRNSQITGVPSAGTTA